MAGSRSTAPLNRSKSVLIFVPVPWGRLLTVANLRADYQSAHDPERVGNPLQVGILPHNYFFAPMGQFTTTVSIGDSSDAAAGVRMRKRLPSGLGT